MSTERETPDPPARIEAGDPRYCEPSATHRHATRDRWMNNVQPANNTLVGVCFYCHQPVGRKHNRTSSWFVR